MDKKFENFISFLQTFVLALAIVIPIRFFLFQPFIVSGASMEPNFKNGEYLLIDEISFRFRTPERGEVIVFKYPKDPSYYYIKRVIGLPGETIKLDDNKIWIYNFENPQGQLLKENYIQDMTIGKEKITLSKDEYFVMGDNRQHSSDSRVFGPVSKNSIVGRTWIALYPSWGFKLLKGAIYSK
jgi:signal peptidase I